MYRSVRILSVVGVAIAAACGDSTAAPVPSQPLNPVTPAPDIPAAQLNRGCAGAVMTFPAFAPTPGNTPVVTGGTFAARGRGNFRPLRTTAELAVRGDYAYTTTWGNTSAAGSAIYVWNVSADTPMLVDSISVSFATTLGDIAISDDGALLVVATERANGSIVLFDLANPQQPALITCFRNDETTAGVHTAEIGRVGGRLYAFLAIDQGAGVASKLVTVDLGEPTKPMQVFSQVVGSPPSKSRIGCPPRRPRRRKPRRISCRARGVRPPQDDERQSA